MGFLQILKHIHDKVITTGYYKGLVEWCSEV